MTPENRHASRIRRHRCGWSFAPSTLPSFTTRSARRTTTIAWLWTDQTTAWLLCSRPYLGSSFRTSTEVRRPSLNLSSALEKSIQTKNVLAGTFAKAGIGYQCYREGRFQEARDWIAQALAESHASGLILEYVSDLVLETLFELDRKGFECIPSFDLQQ